MVEFSSQVLGTINNKSQRNDRGKCLGWPVTSYGAAICGQTHESLIYAMYQQVRAHNLTICYRNKQIDVTFSCVCPVIDNEFRHTLPKQSVDPLGYRLVDPQLL